MLAYMCVCMPNAHTNTYTQAHTINVRESDILENSHIVLDGLSVGAPPVSFEAHHEDVRLQAAQTRALLAAGLKQTS